MVIMRKTAPGLLIYRALHRSVQLSLFFPPFWKKLLQYVLVLRFVGQRSCNECDHGQAQYWRYCRNVIVSY
jgi:hypothetical protein